MARKSSAQAPRSQKANTKIIPSAEEKAEMIRISKELGEQSTFNTDPISELVADGEVEHAV